MSWWWQSSDKDDEDDDDVDDDDIDINTVDVEDDDDGGDGDDGDDGDGNGDHHGYEYCGGPFVYKKLPWGFFDNYDDDFPSKWPAFSKTHMKKLKHGTKTWPDFHELIAHVLISQCCF